MGTLHVAPVGTPFPDPEEEPAPPWREVGIVSLGQDFWVSCLSESLGPDSESPISRSLKQLTLSFEAMADIDWSALTGWFDRMTKAKEKAKRLRKMHTDYARRTRRRKGKR